VCATLQEEKTSTG